MNISFVKKLEGKSVMLIVEGVAHLLTSDGSECNATEIPSLCSSQEETDMCIILYVKHAVKKDISLQ